MRKINWKKLTLGLLTGSIMFQLPGCTESAIYVSAIASAVTAGGVVYLVRRVID